MLEEEPTIGDKYRCHKKRGIFTYMGKGQSGDVVWYDFADTKDGKRHSFYPDEVYPADAKPTRKKRATKTSSKSSTDMTVKDSKAKTVTIGGETITVI